jgi:hypothetical protein
MSNVTLRENIRKYLGIPLDYLTSELGNSSFEKLIDMWDDIKNFTQKLRIKSKQSNFRFAMKHGYAFSSALGTKRWSVDRFDFLSKILKVRYFVEENYNINLHNLPYYYF